MHLGDGCVDVMNRNLIAHDQAARIGRRELREYVVERPSGFCSATLHIADIAKRADFGVNDFDIDAVGIHVGESI